MSSSGFTRRTTLFGACGLLGAASLSACGDYATDDEVLWGSSGKEELRTIALDSAFAFVDTRSSTVFLVDADAGTPKSRAVEIGSAPVKMEKRAGQNQLLVLTQGVVGERGLKEEGAVLWIIPAAASATMPATPVMVPLDARYTNFAQSADGRRVVLYFSGNTLARGNVAYNPNQIAIIDNLDAPVAQKRTIPSLGGEPTSIEFSPQLALTVPRSLLLVRATNYVILLDVENAARPEVRIPLTLPEDGRRLNPVQVVWDPQGTMAAMGPRLFLRVDEGNDIFAIRLAPLMLAPGEELTKNDYSAVLSQLAAGRQPSDMVLYDAGEGPRLLVAGSDNAIFVIEPGSSLTVQIPTQHPVGWISTWFPPVAIGGEPKPPQALLLSPAGDAVTFVELKKLESLKTRNLDLVKLGVPTKGNGSPPDVLPLPSQGLFIVRYSDNSLKVIGLADRSVSPINSTVGITEIRASAASPQTLWLITNGSRLGSMSLQPGALVVADVLLDAPVRDVMVTALSPDGKRKLLVAHKDAAGYVTVLDAQNPTRETAKSLRGFVFAGLLARTKRNVP